MSQPLQQSTTGAKVPVHGTVSWFNLERGFGVAIVTDQPDLGDDVTVLYRRNNCKVVTSGPDGLVLTNRPDTEADPQDYARPGATLVMQLETGPRGLLARRWNILKEPDNPVPSLALPAVPHDSPTLTTAELAIPGLPDWSDAVPIEDLSPYTGSLVIARRLCGNTLGAGYGGTMTSCGIAEGRLVIALRYPDHYRANGTRHDMGVREYRLSYRPVAVKRVDVRHGFVIDVTEAERGRTPVTVWRINFGA
jgi:hypothetical protein